MARRLTSSAFSLVELLVYLALVTSAIALFFQLEVLNHRTLAEQIRIWKVEKSALFLETFLFQEIQKASQWEVSSNKLTLKTPKRHFSLLWQKGTLLFTEKGETHPFPLEMGVEVSMCRFQKWQKGISYYIELKCQKYQEVLRGIVTPVRNKR